MGYGPMVLVHEPYLRVLDRVRDALVGHDFTILTETDVSSLLSDRLGVEMLPQTVLGVCTALLLGAVLAAEPSVGLLVPSTVVVRAQTADVTVVEAANPMLLAATTGNPSLESVAADVTARMTAALGSLALGLTADQPDRPVIRAGGR